MDGIDSILIRDVPGGVILPVKAVPNASRDKIAGPLGAELKITTATPPEKGKANLAIAKFLAKTLGIDRKAITLAAGASNPHKEFHIANLTARELRTRLRDL